MQYQHQHIYVVVVQSDKLPSILQFYAGLVHIKNQPFPHVKWLIIYYVCSADGHNPLLSRYPVVSERVWRLSERALSLWCLLIVPMHARKAEFQEHLYKHSRNDARHWNGDFSHIVVCKIGGSGCRRKSRSWPFFPKTERRGDQRDKISDITSPHATTTPNPKIIQRTLLLRHWFEKFKFHMPHIAMKLSEKRMLVWLTCDSWDKEQSRPNNGRFTRCPEWLFGRPNKIHGPILCGNTIFLNAWCVGNMRDEQSQQLARLSPSFCHCCMFNITLFCFGRSLGTRTTKYPTVATFRFSRKLSMVRNCASYRNLALLAWWKLVRDRARSFTIVASWPCKITAVLPTFVINIHDLDRYDSHSKLARSGWRPNGPSEIIVAIFGRGSNPPNDRQLDFWT